MRDHVRKHWPCYAAALVFVLILGLMLVVAMGRSDGHLVYPLDDTYIHMAMAKNLVSHGVWGLTRYEFTSASSSLLWTLLLALSYRILGVNAVAPLLLNIVFGVLGIVLAYLMLRKTIAHALVVFFVLLVFLFVTPLFTLAAIGMEHTLQVVTSLAFVFLVAAALEQNSAKWTSPPMVKVLVAAALVVSVRYEGLFLVAAACLLLVLRGRVHHAVLVAAAGAIPLVVYGLVAVRHGWCWLPNSVLLKGTVPDVASVGGMIHFVRSAYVRIVRNQHIYSLLLAGMVVLCLYRLMRMPRWAPGAGAMGLWLIALLLHVAFADLGWLYRYEGYLVAMGVVLCAYALGEAVARGRASMPAAGGVPVVATVLGIVLALPLVQRGARAMEDTMRAPANIYHQHVQVGLFLKEHYNGQSVIANDVGAISYLADIRLLDLLGLASMDVARARGHGALAVEDIERLAAERASRIAIVNSGTFDVPSEWTLVEEWTIPDNVICASDTIAFYAVGPAETSALAESLARFRDRLPEEVGEVSYVRHEPQP